MSPEKIQPDSLLKARQPSSGGLALSSYLDRLKAPVDFACRADGSKLGQIQNLGAFLSQCVRDELRNAYFTAIHPQLRHLSDLTANYDRLPPERRKARLEMIRNVVEGLFQSSSSSQRTRAASRFRSGRKLELGSAIENLPGVGPRKAEALRRLGIHTVEDAAWWLPWRYLDRTHPIPLSALRPGDVVTVCGVLRTVNAVVTARRRLRIVQALLGDATGNLVIKWFNQGYLQARLVPGQVLMCSGRVKSGAGLLGSLEMENPQFEIVDSGEGESLHIGRVVPIYHETRGVNSRMLRGCIDHILRTVGSVTEEWLPEDIRLRCGLVSRSEAFWKVHFPPSDVDLLPYQTGVSASHQRLAFEELFLIELGLVARRREAEQELGGTVIRCDPARLDQFLNALPFSPTGAQRRVIGELLTDMRSVRPMNRLVQGDVGCGKTVVAAAAIWMAVSDGHQCALMAPTELLAEQHYRNLERMLGVLGVRMAILTSDCSRAERVVTGDRLARGDIDCVVGTHALAQPDVRFARFGLAVIDEQHKFGVLQRSHLVGKGYRPDVIIMTATPIPRTLAMTVYGDLDVSLIDEMPPGRRPVVTQWYHERQRPLATDLIRRELQAGRQAYVVAPVLEESRGGEVKSAMDVAERLRNGVFRDVRVGLLHGRMKRTEKDRVMREFREGAIRVLVATTVVEVGVDVPDATVMLIEHAERYGLAQLHQLRGRIGRGGHQGFCLLLTGTRLSEDARQRLETMVDTHDGFLIAERDLALRGPGELLGTRQSGLPDLRVANLVRDGELLDCARSEAIDLLRRDPSLADPCHAALKLAFRRAWGTRIKLRSIG